MNIILQFFLQMSSKYSQVLNAVKDISCVQEHMNMVTLSVPLWCPWGLKARRRIPEEDFFPPVYFSLLFSFSSRRRRRFYHLPSSSSSWVQFMNIFSFLGPLATQAYTFPQRRETDKQMGQFPPPPIPFIRDIEHANSHTHTHQRSLCVSHPWKSIHFLVWRDPQNSEQREG